MNHRLVSDIVSANLAFACFKYSIISGISCGFDVYDRLVKSYGSL